MQMNVYRFNDVVAGMGEAWLDFSISVAPLGITLGFVLGTLDFLVGGSLVDNVIFQWLWALLQSISLESLFTVTILLASSRHMTGKMRVFFAGIAVPYGLVGGVILLITSLQMLTHTNQQNAMDIMRISPTAFMFARSVLNVVAVPLLFIVQRSYRYHRVQASRTLSSYNLVQSRTNVQIEEVPEQAQSRVETTQELAVRINREHDERQAQLKRENDARLRAYQARTTPRTDELASSDMYTRTLVQARTDEQPRTTEENVRAYLVQNPDATVREIASALNISQGSAGKYSKLVRATV